VADIAAGEIDRSSGTWIVPAKRAKNGRAITLPLPALALVELLPLGLRRNGVAVARSATYGTDWDVKTGCRTR
jgi:hypothetical protein